MNNRAKKANMKIYHTSPKKILKIHQNGLFADCLCFSIKPYFMCSEKIKTWTYSIEIQDNESINICSFFHHENWKKLDAVVADIVNYCDDECIDEDVARDLLDGSKNIDDLNDDYGNFKWSDSEGSELSWYMQKKQGEAAKVLGYKAAESEDEQGCLFIVNMTDRLNELKL